MSKEELQSIQEETEVGIKEKGEEKASTIWQIAEEMKIPDRGIKEDFEDNQEIKQCLRTLQESIDKGDVLGVHSAFEGLRLIRNAILKRAGEQALPEKFQENIERLRDLAEGVLSGELGREANIEIYTNQGLEQHRKAVVEFLQHGYGKLADGVVRRIKGFDFLGKHPRLARAASIAAVAGLSALALGGNVFAAGAEDGGREAEEDEDDTEDWQTSASEFEEPATQKEEALVEDNSRSIVPEFMKSEREKAKEIKKERSMPIRIEVGRTVGGENHWVTPQEIKAFSNLDEIIGNPYGEGLMNNAKYGIKIYKDFDKTFLNEQDDAYHFEAYGKPGERVIICGFGGGGISEKYYDYDLSKYYDPETNSYIIPKNSPDLSRPRHYFKGMYKLEYQDTEGKLEEPTENEMREWLMDANTFESLKANHYYKELDINKTRDALYGVLQAFKEAGEKQDDKDIEKTFFKYLKKEGASEMSESQKALMLQFIGKIFYKNYDEEMAKSTFDTSGGEISLSQFIKAASNYIKTGEEIPTGVCRQIAARVATIGHDALGMDTLSSTVMKGEPHIISGFKSQDNGKIIFLDGSQLIDTGTPDFKKALGKYERISGGIMAGGSIVSDKEGGPLTRIQSRAGEDIYEAGLVKRPSEVIENDLGAGELIQEKGLDILITPEKQRIKYDKDYLTIAYTRFDRDADPYNSLKDLHGVGLELRKAGEHQEIHLGTAVFKEQIKKLGTGVINDPEILLRIGGRYANRKDLPKNWSLGLAAAIEGVAIANSKSVSSLGAEGSYGARLNYYNPKDQFQFYIGARQDVEIIPKNVQGGLYYLRPRLTGTELEVGSRIDIAGRARVNVAGNYDNADYGKVIGVKADIEAGGFRVEGGYSETKSGLFFIPNNEHGQLAITKENLPFIAGAKGALTVFGAMDKKNYNVPRKEETKEYGVKAIIVFE